MSKNTLKRSPIYYVRLVHSKSAITLHAQNFKITKSHLTNLEILVELL